MKHNRVPLLKESVWVEACKLSRGGALLAARTTSSFVQDAPYDSRTGHRFFGAFHPDESGRLHKLADGWVPAELTTRFVELATDAGASAGLTTDRRFSLVWRRAGLRSLDTWQGGRHLLSLSGTRVRVSGSRREQGSLFSSPPLAVELAVHTARFWPARVTWSVWIEFPDDKLEIGHRRDYLPSSADALDMVGQAGDMMDYANDAANCLGVEAAWGDSVRRLYAEFQTEAPNRS